MKCQRCRQAIKLHGSLDDMSPAAFNLLIGASEHPTLVEHTPSTKPAYPPDRREAYEKAVRDAGGAPSYKRHVPNPRSSRTAQSKSIYQNPAESFVVLTESSMMPPAPSLSRQNSPRTQELERVAADNDQNAQSQTAKRSERLFEILSARTDVDHPICAECSELLVEGYTKRLQVVTKERDAFVEFLKRVNAEIPTEAEQEAQQEELRRLEEEDAEALQDLEDLERERAEVEAETKRLEEESRELDKEEEEFWRDRNAFTQKLDEFQNIRDCVNQQYDHDSKQLEKLQRTNVYNDTFNIGHDGFFGTINSLRLGRLPNQAQQVEWAEVNAAWGQTLLLLATIAEKLGFAFSGYRLKPMGSTSKIDKLDPPSSASSTEPKITTLELFSSGDMPIGRMFMYRKFDMAMVAFLECLRQVAEFVEQRDPTMKLPYKIAKDKIGDSCIRLAFNQDEAWTRACKYTLTCVKFLLAHTR
ncbi:autophagy protein Apg6-domain-containing protein [Tricharina praecox]|uniref:autophagy protein Apg6-domain-containing protein n=1 Tax=Tricharina praecox TaxID=43433 RepID=UPI00221F37F9|nr:autophagy protein Apg6-domain-containing protein [Tricharina praecox]KAI5846890.1 autophagy protein Apg6-domain-containing protein [Tricharina praecox]